MRVRETDEFRYRTFIKKAEEFYQEMANAQENERWNATGLNGIHCMISSCDALTVYFLGKRCAGEKHEEIVELVNEIKDLDATLRKEKVAQILSILKPKTRVEYESDLFGESEAKMLAKQVERFHLWARGLLPK